MTMDRKGSLANHSSLHRRRREFVDAAEKVLLEMSEAGVSRWTSPLWDFSHLLPAALHAAREKLLSPAGIWQQH